MSPTLDAQKERKCSTYSHYGFRPGNPKGWRWTCCKKKEILVSGCRGASGRTKGM